MCTVDRPEVTWPDQGHEETQNPGHHKKASRKAAFLFQSVSQPPCAFPPFQFQSPFFFFLLSSSVDYDALTRLLVGISLKSNTLTHWSINAKVSVRTWYTIRALDDRQTHSVKLQRWIILFDWSGCTMTILKFARAMWASSSCGGFFFSFLSLSYCRCSHCVQIWLEGSSFCSSAAPEWILAVYSDHRKS